LEKEASILKKFYWVSAIMLLIAVCIAVRLVDLQLVEGDAYREKAEAATLKNFTIAPNRGNIFGANNQLLASSVPEYEVRFDAVTVPEEIYRKEIKMLADSLADFLKTSPSSIKKKLDRARLSKNRYLLIAKNLDYESYIRIKAFPIFKHGPYKGGFVTEQETVREHPLGDIASRTIGYHRNASGDEEVKLGIEGAYTHFLAGKQGQRLKQKIAHNQWKPVNDVNEIEPKDGFDLVTTIDVTIQDIAHHALLEQLITYQAEHGTVMVMETATGDIKAVSNLGRTKSGKYIESFNYAIGESHEPGSTFKIMGLLAALEDKVIDTSDVVDTENGIISFYGRKVRDSNRKGYGKISIAEATVVSSNTAFARMITDSYGDNPSKFTDRLHAMNVDQKTGILLEGEGTPKIPNPSKKGWNGLSLPWMAFGYGVSLTPLQTLTFYNAIGNNGIMVKPRFVEEIREWDQVVHRVAPEIINPQIASPENIKKVQKILENTVTYGTGKSLYNPDFSLAGKTGTCQTDYWTDSLSYISSFVGYFPAQSPKFSVIVVIHKPEKKIGYYGADVAGPVFKKIAQKIHVQSVRAESLQWTDKVSDSLNKSYNRYFSLLRQEKNVMTDLTGVTGMDAVALLENEGFTVEVEGLGKVIKQSPEAGTPIQKNETVKLTLQ